MSEFSLFDTHTSREHAASIAAYLPGGIMFEAARIDGTNTSDLLVGFAGELKRVETELINYVEQYGIEKTTLLLTEWEKSLGIPDDCFDGTGDVATRRRDILTKLASLGVQTADDFVELALIFGITVTVEGGLDSSVVFADDRTARFTIVVTFEVTEANEFPFDYPIVFGDDSIAILECLFDKLKPENCAIIFQQA